MSDRRKSRGGRPSKYAPEFRRDAVAIVLDEGRSIADVGRSLLGSPWPPPSRFSWPLTEDRGAICEVEPGLTTGLEKTRRLVRFSPTWTVRGPMETQAATLAVRALGRHAAIPSARTSPSLWPMSRLS